MGNQQKLPDKKQPEDKYKAGGMSVSTWLNEAKKDNKTFTFKTLTLQRSYKDAKGDWQNPSLSLRITDVPKAILVLTEAYKDALLNANVEVVEDAE